MTADCQLGISNFRSPRQNSWSSSPNLLLHKSLWTLLPKCIQNLTAFAKLPAPWSEPKSSEPDYCNNLLSARLLPLLLLSHAPHPGLRPPCRSLTISFQGPSRTRSRSNLVLSDGLFTEGLALSLSPARAAPTALASSSRFEITSLRPWHLSFPLPGTSVPSCGRVVVTLHFGPLQCHPWGSVLDYPIQNGTCFDPFTLTLLAKDLSTIYYLSPTGISGWEYVVPATFPRFRAEPGTW